MESLILFAFLAVIATGESTSFAFFPRANSRSESFSHKTDICVLISSQGDLLFL